MGLFSRNFSHPVLFRPPLNADRNRYRVKRTLTHSKNGPLFRAPSRSDHFQLPHGSHLFTIFARPCPGSKVVLCPFSVFSEFRLLIADPRAFPGSFRFHFGLRGFRVHFAFLFPYGMNFLIAWGRGQAPCDAGVPQVSSVMTLLSTNLFVSPGLAVRVKAGSVPPPALAIRDRLGRRGCHVVHLDHDFVVQHNREGLVTDLVPHRTVNSRGSLSSNRSDSRHCDVQWHTPTSGRFSNGKVGPSFSIGGGGQSN
jgi:hypothetical protein